MQNYMAVIQAGGRGMRMEQMTGGRIPKPMLRLNGKPMLEWQIENITKYGIHDFVIITGYLGEKIKEYFGDGSRLGVRIQYIEEKEPLGSGGALFLLKPLVGRSDFLFIFGDVMFDLDIKRMVQFHKKQSGWVTLLVHPNAHPYDSDLLLMDHTGRVTGIDSKHKKRDYWYENCVNAGIYMFSAEVLDFVPAGGKMDMEQDVLLPLIRQKKVYGYRTPEYVKDAGTPERFCKVSQEQAEGVWERKNLENEQVCVFLDRDGTINKYCGLLHSEEQFELETGVAEAISKLNEAGFLTVIVTNQPVVARGLCEIEDVEQIHRKMQVLLGEKGAYLDDIVFCPHHPDQGFPEENPVYKRKCGCRKPATGMIVKTAKQYHIDLSRSYMVGDSTVDIQTGKNAGLRTILLLSGQAGKDGKYDVVPDGIVKNMEEAVAAILADNKIRSSSHD